VLDSEIIACSVTVMKGDELGREEEGVVKEKGDREHA
jgi:hypothetical protein